MKEINKIIRRFIISIVVICVSTHVLIAQENYRLMYNLEKGRIFSYKGDIEMKIVQETAGSEMNINTAIYLKLKCLVDNILENKNLTIITTIEDCKIKAHSMIDTILDNKKIIGKREIFTVTPLGRIIKTDNPDSIDAYEMQIDKLNIFFKYPDKLVKTGEKWQTEKNDSVDFMGGKGINKTETEYTLIQTEQKNGHECVKISFTGKSEITGKLSQMGIDMYVEGPGKVVGTAYCEISSGLIVEAEIQNDMELTIAFVGEQNTAIPLLQSNKIKLSLIEK